jgi:hypothetical protein
MFAGTLGPERLAVGDVINSPPNVPQNWLSTPSSPSRDFIVKVEETG